MSDSSQHAYLSLLAPLISKVIKKESDNAIQSQGDNCWAPAKAFNAIGLASHSQQIILFIRPSQHNKWAGLKCQQNRRYDTVCWIIIINAEPVIENYLAKCWSANWLRLPLLIMLIPTERHSQLIKSDVAEIRLDTVTIWKASMPICTSCLHAMRKNYLWHLTTSKKRISWLKTWFICMVYFCWYMNNINCHKYNLFSDYLSILFTSTLMGRKDQVQRPVLGIFWI